MRAHHDGGIEPQTGQEPTTLQGNVLSVKDKSIILKHLTDPTIPHKVLTVTDNHFNTLNKSHHSSAKSGQIQTITLKHLTTDPTILSKNLDSYRQSL